MNARAFLAVTLLGITSVAHADVVSLAELEKRALERHVSLLASEARTRAAEAGVREAWSQYLPHVGLNVDSNVSPGRQIATILAENGDRVQVQAVPAIQTTGGDRDQRQRAFAPSWRTTAMLQVGATLYDFGRTGATVAASRARQQAAKAEQDVSRAEVVAMVRGAYLTWLSASELHRIAADASRDGARRSERVTALISEGARPRGDLAPVESERLLSQLELDRAEADLETARLSLEYAVGDRLPEQAEPDLKLLEIAPPPESTQPDPSLRLLVFQRAAQEATARAQRRVGAPVLSAIGGAGIGLQRGFGPDETANRLRILPSWQVGLGLSIPIWDGGGSRASAEGTDARADELRIRMEGAEAERNQEHAKAGLDATHALKRKATAEQLIEVCLARVTDTETGYELGAMQFDQVQQARSMLRRAQTELVMAKVSRCEALLRVAP